MMAASARTTDGSLIGTRTVSEDEDEEEEEEEGGEDGAASASFPCSCTQVGYAVDGCIFTRWVQMFLVAQSLSSFLDSLQMRQRAVRLSTRVAHVASSFHCPRRLVVNTGRPSVTPAHFSERGGVSFHVL
jgi:hypothetical protein